MAEAADQFRSLSDDQMLYDADKVRPLIVLAGLR